MPGGMAGVILESVGCVLLLSVFVASLMKAARLLGV